MSQEKQSSGFDLAIQVGRDGRDDFGDELAGDFHGRGGCQTLLL